jgi:hypothetical protein
MNPDQKMSLDELHTRLQAIGVDIPKDTLKGWAYHKPPIITPPERYKHGKGTGKKGRAVEWSEESLGEAAAVWAIRNSPRIAHRPSLHVIQCCLKHSVDHIYDEPSVTYDFSSPAPEEKVTYKSLKLAFFYHGYGELEGKQPPPTEWQELLITWIAAKEKAKKDISIKEPRQVRFHWSASEKGEGVAYKLEKVTLEPSESDHDEITVYIGGADFRKQLFQLLGYAGAFKREPLP